MKVISSLAVAACVVLVFTHITKSQTTEIDSPSNVEILKPLSITGPIKPTIGTPARSFTRKQPGPPSGLLAPLDEKFVADTAMSNNAVIAMGRMAIDRAALPSVQDYAQRSLQSSISANQTMAQLLEDIGIKLPEGVALNDQFVIDGLQNLKGTDFDQAYVRQQLGLLAISIDTFKDAEKKMKDKHLRAFARDRRHSIEERYEELRVLDNRSSPAMSMVVSVDQ